MPLDTLSGPVSHALEVKHSRFIAHAAPVADAEDATAFMQRMHVADATHHCWAWRIGGHYRSSDDGEPAGTAGRPILAAIDGQGFDRIAVVVVRWYGGIKLGAGGLVRAYGGCAAECLRIAPRVALVEMTTLRVHAPFDAIGSVHAALPAALAVKREEHFDADGLTLLLELPSARVEDLKTRLRNASRNRVRIGDNG